MSEEKTLGNGDLVRMSHKNGSPPEETSRPLSSPAAAMYKTITPHEFASPSTAVPPAYIAPASLYNDSIPSPALAPWERAKLILSVTAITNAVLAMVLLSSMVSTPQEMSSALGMFISPATAAVALWNMAEMARRIDVPGGGGITPGAHVGVRLILCGTLITMVSMTSSLGIMSTSSRFAVLSGNPIRAGDAPMAWTIIVLCGIGAVIEFVLFVRACCEEAWRRKAIQRERIDQLRKAGNYCGITA